MILLLVAVSDIKVINSSLISETKTEILITETILKIIKERKQKSKTKIIWTVK